MSFGVVQSHEAPAPTRPIPGRTAWHASCSTSTQHPVTTALDELLARSLPPGTSTAGPRRVALRVSGREFVAAVTGLGARLLQLAHGAPSDARVGVGTRAILSVDLEGGAVRIDLPVEVATWGRAHVVLRVIGAPLVLRRRIVRDQALADALGAPEPRAAVVAAA